MTMMSAVPDGLALLYKSVCEAWAWRNQWGDSPRLNRAWLFLASRLLCVKSNCVVVRSRVVVVMQRGFRFSRSDRVVGAAG